MKDNIDKSLTALVDDQPDQVQVLKNSGLNGRPRKITSIYFLVPAPPGYSPGQRFRFEHYLGSFESSGLAYRISSFYSEKGWKLLYTPGNLISKAWIVFIGFLRRWIDLFRIIRYDRVFIYREAAPLGPPFFEWVIAKVWRKKIIYDFDDSIWVPVYSEYNRVAGFLRWFSKVSTICRYAYKVSVGNRFLADFVRKYNPNVEIIPTVINTKQGHYLLRDQTKDSPVIGWTGTFSTLKYLELVIPVLKKLQGKIDFKFIVIADTDPKLSLNNYEFIKWDKSREMQDLLKLHIGLMPLHDDELSKGKCGFKAIQYLALGIPAVVSPVGVNSSIVEDGINGFLCRTDEEWEERLTQLLENTQLRIQMGMAGRKKMDEEFSVHATLNSFLGLFD